MKGTIELRTQQFLSKRKIGKCSNSSGEKDSQGQAYTIFWYTFRVALSYGTRVSASGVYLKHEVL